MRNSLTDKVLLSLVRQAAHFHVERIELHLSPDQTHPALNHLPLFGSACLQIRYRRVLHTPVLYKSPRRQKTVPLRRHLNPLRVWDPVLLVTRLNLPHALFVAHVRPARRAHPRIQLRKLVPVRRHPRRIPDDDLLKIRAQLLCRKNLHLAVVHVHEHLRRRQKPLRPRLPRLVNRNRRLFRVVVI